MTPLAHTFLAAREAKAYSQRDLARLAGTTQQCVSRVERGDRVPSIVTYLKLVRTLGLDPWCGLVAVDHAEEVTQAAA
jgi:transcriptional regulator with XRE-family HTH domain